MRGITTAMPKHVLRRLAPGLLLVLAGCHHVNHTVSAGPDVQFQTAMRQFRAGEYSHAQDNFQRLQFELPARDTLLAQARFYAAECMAAAGDILGAAREFRRVSDDFPGEPLAPYALLRVGDQYARLWRRPELDPTHGETAVATWQELVGRYPESPAAELAQVRIRGLQDQYARKDYMNGLFYFKRGGYDSAILYFRSLIASYPGSSVVPEAYVKLVQAYKAIGYREERDETCAHLQQYFGGRADVRAVCGNGSPGR